MIGATISCDRCGKIDPIPNGQTVDLSGWRRFTAKGYGDEDDYDLCWDCVQIEKNDRIAALGKKP